jgi:hypothetical protein
VLGYVLIYLQGNLVHVATRAKLVHAEVKLLGKNRKKGFYDLIVSVAHMLSP